MLGSGSNAVLNPIIDLDDPSAPLIGFEVTNAGSGYDLSDLVIQLIPTIQTVILGEREVFANF